MYGSIYGQKGPGVSFAWRVYSVSMRDSETRRYEDDILQFNLSVKQFQALLGNQISVRNSILTPLEIASIADCTNCQIDTPYHATLQACTQ